MRLGYALLGYWWSPIHQQSIHNNYFRILRTPRSWHDLTRTESGDADDNAKEKDWDSGRVDDDETQTVPFLTSETGLSKLLIPFVIWE